MKRIRGSGPSLFRAFDEARFGADRTLNLRAKLPTVAEAETQTERWLRQKQVEGAAEVLIITGRGRNSPGGVSPVRQAVAKLLSALKRKGVVSGVSEHTAGSFLVKLASVRRLLENPPRRRDGSRRGSGAAAAGGSRSVPGLEGLSVETRRSLQSLASRHLDVLGVHFNQQMLRDEMQRQFSILAGALPDGSEKETRLRAAAERALLELEENA